MGNKEKRRVILVAQCLLNPYCRVHILGQNFPFSRELSEYLMRKKIGIIQYACPETTAMGLMRNPQGRQQYNNIFFRDHCRKLLDVPLLMVREFLENRYRLVAFIGLENSPTCGIHWGKHKVNRYRTESPEKVTELRPGEPVLMGIMAEMLSAEFNRAGISVPFLEFPANSTAESPERRKFWTELQRIVEPYLFEEDGKPASAGKEAAAGD